MAGRLALLQVVELPLSLVPLVSPTPAAPLVLAQLETMVRG